MTSQTRVTNTARFESGDQPSGSNFKDLIDSYLSLIDTSAQAIVSNITIPTLTVTTVSAGTIFADTIAGSITFSGVVSADSGLIVSGATRFNTIVSADGGITASGAAQLKGTLTVTGITSCAAIFADSGTLSGTLQVAGITSAGAVFADALTVDGLLTLNTATTAEAGATAAYVQVNIAGTLRSIRVFATS